MIYRIASAPAKGKGLVGVYPEWENGGTGTKDKQFLEQQTDFSMLFTRNYCGQFVKRIERQLLQFGRYIDIVCGWEPEKLRMLFLPFNPSIEVLRLSAMHFNTFDLISTVRNECARFPPEKKYDIFFSMSQRPDNLKQVDLLCGILSRIQQPTHIIGFGRLSDTTLIEIRKNKNVSFYWCGKAKVTDTGQRLNFLTELAKSRCLLVTSRVEGYCRLMGEALLLGVPILLDGEILCENWLHLNADNCRMFTEAAFDICLKDILSRAWNFTPPVYEDGNKLLQSFFKDFLHRRGLPLPETWFPLKYGALTDQRVL
jgi:glycosyltransferase involved in cell wall biosynthesis